jgi:hypothetical protein
VTTRHGYFVACYALLYIVGQYCLYFVIYCLLAVKCEEMSQQHNIQKPLSIYLIYLMWYECMNGWAMENENGRPNKMD